MLKLLPKREKNEIAGICGNFLRIKISSLPIKEKTNKELIKFLSKVFNVSKNNILITKGQRRSLKTVFVPVVIEKLLEAVR